MTVPANLTATANRSFGGLSNTLRGGTVPNTLGGRGVPVTARDRGGPAIVSAAGAVLIGIALALAIGGPR